MKELKEFPQYALMKIMDKTMGVTSTDACARSKEREHFLSMMAFNTFCLGGYKYSPLESSVLYVVLFKIDHGASITNKRVVKAGVSVEQNAPVYYYLRETKNDICMLCISTGVNDQLVYTTLGTILSDYVV